MLAPNDHPQHNVPPCRCLWPQPAMLWFAGKAEPVIVLGLEDDGELRVIRADGRIGRVAEHRVILERRDLP